MFSDSDKEVRYFIVGTLLAFCLSIIENVRSAHPLLTGLTFIVYGSVFLYLQVVRIKQGERPSSGRYFWGIKSFGEASQEVIDRYVWPRKEKVVQEIIDLLSGKKKPHGRKGAIHIITGESGSGKSVLLRYIIFPALKETGKVSINYYENCDDEIDKIKRDFQRVSKLASVMKCCFVFDQFERLAYSSKDIQKVFKQLLQEMNRLQYEVVIVTRSDYYYSLRFLDELLPAPNLALEIPRLMIDRDSELTRTLKNNLANLATPDCVETILGDFSLSLGNDHREGLLALDLQMAGTILELEYERQRKVTLDFYLSEVRERSKLVNRYFAIYISSSPKPHVAEVVLFSLSVGSQLRTVLAFDQICAITYFQREDVRLILNDFLELGLIKHHHATDSYEWVHDLLPNGFRIYASSKMDADLRDTIYQSVQEHDATSQTAAMSKSSGRNVLRADKTTEPTLKRRKTICSIGFLFVLCGSLVRMALGTGNTSLDPYVKVLNQLYIGFGLSHIAWAVYIISLLNGFFIHLGGRYLRALWVPLLLGSVSAGVTGWFFPAWWLLPIAATGFLLGCIYLWIAFMSNLGHLARQRFLRQGAPKVLLNIPFAAVGVVYGLFARYLQQNPDFQANKVMMSMTALELFVLISACLSAVMIIVAALYYRRDTGSLIYETQLGLVDRPR